MLVECWPIVFDAGPTFSQHWFSDSSLMGTGIRQERRNPRSVSVAFCSCVMTIYWTRRSSTTGDIGNGIFLVPGGGVRPFLFPPERRRYDRHYGALMGHAAPPIKSASLLNEWGTDELPLGRRSRKHNNTGTGGRPICIMKLMFTKGSERELVCTQCVKQGTGTKEKHDAMNANCRYKALP